VDLTIILPSPRVGDFVWTWYGDCIVTESTLSLFRDAGFTGFHARPVTVEKIKRLSRKRSEEVTIPPLWEILITGKGGDAAPESGIRVIDRDEESGVLSYSSFRNGIIVDEANWDGSDFFTINGYPSYILITERVKELIVSRQLTNCALILSKELQWTSGFRFEEYLEKRRTLAKRDLSSLIADLEGSDESKWLDTIHALGAKGDPLAVDALLKKFSHPYVLVWSPAASAVAKIARRKDVPEPVREEIFSKLRSLLADPDLFVRKSAATAIGHIGGDRAADEVMRLLDDPEDSVRRTAVFVLGFLRYKPALEAIKRLTRDRSKSVRENARRVTSELTSGLY